MTYSYPQHGSMLLQQHQHPSQSSSTYSKRYDSIYSMTPFVGDAATTASPCNWTVTSPSSSSRASHPMSVPSDHNPVRVQFDFPPELRDPSVMSAAATIRTTTTTADSSFSSQESSSFKENRLVEYNAYNAGAMVVATQPSSVVGSSYMIKVPRSNNAHGSDAVHPEKSQMKKQRKRRTAAGAVGGMVVGGTCGSVVGRWFGRSYKFSALI
jgi:hypothetical protein